MIHSQKYPFFSSSITSGDDGGKKRSDGLISEHRRENEGEDKIQAKAKAEAKEKYNFVRNEKMMAITLSNLRKRFRYFFNLMINPSKALIMKRTNNDDKHAMLSLQEDNAMTETNYLLSTEANRKRLLESIRQIEGDKLIPYELNNESES